MASLGYLRRGNRRVKKKRQSSSFTVPKANFGHDVCHRKTCHMATLTRSSMSFLSSEVEHECAKKELEQNERSPEGDACWRNDWCVEP